MAHLNELPEKFAEDSKNRMTAFKKAFSAFRLAFRSPWDPLPVKMKGFAKLALRRALKNTSAEDLPIIIDGKEYRVVEESRYKRQFNFF